MDLRDANPFNVEFAGVPGPIPESILDLLLGQAVSGRTVHDSLEPAGARLGRVIS